MATAGEEKMEEALSQAQFDNVPRGVKRKSLCTINDQAEKMLCKSQPGRAALDHIGMHALNRGGHGVISFHLHRNVLPDVLENGTIADRYAPVRLVEVPQASLDKWRQENKRRCDDPLMPKFSPEMKYCLLTKHHFVHSHKLIKDGDRSVFNEGKHPAKLRDDDEEGKMVQSVGVKAVIYGPELWNDPAALNAIMTADNLDADCRMRENEVDALGRAHTMISTMDLEKPTDDIVTSIDSVMNQMEQVGLGNATPEDMRELVAFRLTLPKPVGQLLITCLLHMTQGRYKAEIVNYKTVASLHLGDKFSIPKICLVLAIYCQFLSASCTDKASSQSGSKFEQLHVKKISSSAVKELSKEHELLEEFGAFPGEIFKNYESKGNEEKQDSGDYTSARAWVLINCGRTLIKVGEKLAQHVKENPLGKSGIPTPEQTSARQKVVL